MAETLRLSIISIGILLMTIFISDSECKPFEDTYVALTNLSDKQPRGYSQYLRKVLMDASHVLDNMIERGKMRIMDLPYEGWIM